MQDNKFGDRAWELGIKVLTDSISPQEIKEWELLLESDPRFKAEFYRIRSIWEKSSQLPYHRINVDADWQRVLKKISREDHWGKRFVQAPVLRYAAVILLCISVAYLLFWLQNKRFTNDYDKILTTIEAPIGSKTHVTLPDSSKIWLNAGSKIYLDNGFGVDNRDITLEGEAFFDVVKNEVPFKVFTEHYDIAVLGTAFNVKAYEDDNTLVTTLVRGSLRVNNIHTPKGKRQALLRPGQKLTFWKKDAPDGDMVKLEGSIDTGMDTAWKDGWLSVSSESLGEFARRLERLYDINIDFENEALKKYRYTGRVRELSLEQVLKALALTSPIDFEIKEKTVLIKENKNTKSKYKRSLQTP